MKAPTPKAHPAAKHRKTAFPVLAGHGRSENVGHMESVALELREAG